MKVLYRDFGAARYRPIAERMANPAALSPHSQVFAPISVLTSEVAERRYQSTPENALSLAWYVKANMDSVRDQKAWDDLVVPAGEKLEILKHLPGWNRLVDVAVLVGCGSHAMSTDIDIVTFEDQDTSILSVAAGVDLSVCDDLAVLAPAAMSYIKRDASYMVKISITPPFTNANGDGVFTKGKGTSCEERACLRLLVHAHLRNMCFSEVLRGCRLEDYCGCASDVLPDDCTETAAAPDVVMPVVTAVADEAGAVGTEITDIALAASEPIASWTATPLPDGLSLNVNTGVISGTPTTAGTTTVVVTATDTAGNVSAAVSFDFVVA